MTTATVMAGIPATNLSLYRAIRFRVGDPAALVLLPRAGGVERLLVIRDIEMERARRHARADRVQCPADFEPAGGLSGDRETATAQSVAECLRREGVTRVRADRSLPLIFAHFIMQAGIALECDVELGVLERRAKDAEELAHLREAQRATEGAMEFACGTVARAKAATDGSLVHEGEPLTAERLRAMIDIHLLRAGYENPDSIVACGPQGADCHDHGHGALHTGQPVIVDIFPRSKSTLYNGDMTRTVVHGVPEPELVRMHAAVVDAKREAIAAIRAGVTGQSVHEATLAGLARHGFRAGQPAEPRVAVISHGTGHGIGLEVHEPPLLAMKGPALVSGDVVTVEPGLYAIGIGGVRVEDMVAVTAEGSENFNRLHEGLDWR
ncbi:MAG: Xaa-Pro peptidase family protein [Planctomycetaceae bacterium]|nr:Xaa-Pro peptidase family protein [Planctomycetaceae bacterium]